MKRSEVFLTTLLIFVLLGSTYSLGNRRKERESLLMGRYIDELKDARGLADVGGTFEHLLRENASDELIISYAHVYSIKAETLKALSASSRHSI